MPNKKVEKKSIKKSVKKSDVHFLGMLVLFAGFSLYAVTSYFSSTSDFIENRYVSVLGNGTEVSSNIEPSCYTCPEPKVDFPVCSELWKSGTCPAQVEDVIDIFNDVDSTHPHAEAIEVLANQGIISGYADSSFKPDNTINRAELLTVLSDAVDADFGGRVLSNCFTDVGTEWFSVFVCYAKEQGWVTGNPDGTYKPADPVNKAGALKIIFGALNYNTCSDVSGMGYTDVTANDWFAPYACQAKNDGLINASTLFDASHQVTRGEFVQMMYNVMKQKGLI